MARIPATEFKAKCLQLMDRVSERRETFVITKRGRPVARLMPVERAAEEPLFGRLKGMAVEESDDLTPPAVPPDVWETLTEWDGLGPRRRKTARRPRRARAGRKRR